MKLFRRKIRNPLLWTGLFFLLVALLLGTAFLFGMFSSEEHPVFTLPPPPTNGALPPEYSTVSGEPTGLSSNPPSPVVHLDVTVDNVLQIVAALPSLEAYQCEWTVEWFWYGGSSHAKRLVFFRDGYMKIEMYRPAPDGVLQQTLIFGGGRTFLVGQSVWQPKQGVFSPESEASLPARETILNLSASDLLEAAYLLWDDRPCVTLVFRVDDVYTDAYWLSLDDGLPFRMEHREGDRVVYGCTREWLDPTRPEEDVFRLPHNNKLAWEQDD